ncbi:unnamed protein product [Pleuronectes platessa]|uniref:Uncharacterized protein n=1 Tax=Pleuronectes platessa TaxID=8262 RepID=A0A9N7V160_PLEPL|nr:unnamed protein product [Pleuronectes platessa]
MVAKQMGHNENPVVIVVSPLVALMEDQVKEATEMGITAMKLSVHDEVDITSGRCQLLFGILAAVQEVYPIERRGIFFPGSVETRPIITAQWSSIRLIF